MKKFILGKLVFLTLTLSLSVTALAQNDANSAVAPNPVEQTETAIKEGKIRIGLADVKTGKVGKGIDAQQLAVAIQVTLGEYLKGTKVEIVPLEARLDSAVEVEAKEKQCDFILYATVSHKKGGGGLAAFAKVAPVLTSVIPIAGVAVGVGGMIAGSVASTAISTAASATAGVKAKDQIILDFKLQNGSTVAFAKQYKAKAKSGGEDIISPMIEQAAQELLDAVSK